MPADSELRDIRGALETYAAHPARTGLAEPDLAPEANEPVSHDGAHAEDDSDLELTPRWPEPLDEAAFHGLAGDVVRALLPHTEADAAAILAQLLVAAGNFVGRGPRCRVEGDIHHTNFNALIIGHTASGRKGTAWGQARRVLHGADPAYVSGKDKNIKSGLSSGEGLVYHVRDESQRSARRSGDSAPVVDPGVKDKRLLVLETELGGPLRQMAKDGNTLSPRIREAFDTGEMSTLTRGEPLTATGAHISIIGHITPEELRRRLSNEEVANGFANRFLYVMARRSKYLPNGGDPESAAMSKLGARLARVRARYTDRPVCVTRDKAAEALWQSYYRDLSDGAPGLLGAITSRGTALVLRLALVYAVLDCSDVITLAHLTAARAVWTYSVRSAAYVFGQQLGDPVAEQIEAALKTHGPKTTTQISDLFDRHVRSSRLRDALVNLQSMGKIEVEEQGTRGRPVQVWSAKKAKEAKEAPDRDLEADEKGLSSLNSLNSHTADDGSELL